MKILIVTDSLFPDEPGGAGRFVNEISKQFKNLGDEVFVITRKTNYPLPKYEVRNGVKIERFDFNPKGGMGTVLKEIINLHFIARKILNENKFDVILFNQPFSTYGVNLFGKTEKIPRVYIFHSPWHQEYEIRTDKKGIGSVLRKFIEKKAIYSCSKAIVLSEYTKELLVDIHHFPSSNIEIIPGGVDIEKFKPAEDKIELRKKMGLPLDKFILFTVRNLTARMGLENLILAMKEVIKNIKDVYLIIGGGGELRKDLEKLASDLGLNDSIKFSGFISEEILPFYYQSADLFILPTKELEGFGLVTIEALACGIPVLGTKIGGTKEILSRLDERLLFSGTDAENIASGIIDYISNRDKFINLSKKGREFVVENYSWEKIAEKLKNILWKIRET